MRVSDLSRKQLAELLRRGEFIIRIGPFIVRIKSHVSSLSNHVEQMYADFEICSIDDFADFHVEISHESGLRRWIKPRVHFSYDGNRSFVPLSVTQAFAMLEWGLNWCVAAHCHQYLVIHAAVIEKNGKGMMLPAPPGAGKSTLCAGLVMRGWRLLSDELALYDLETGLVYGMSRPINLKNKSIEIIRQYAPEAELTASMPNTAKGTVALLRPPQDSVRRINEAIRPSWIILPNYQMGVQAELVPCSKAKTFMLLAEQSFNYDTHGQLGFDAINQLVSSAECYEFTYSLLNDADQVFSQLLNRCEI